MEILVDMNVVQKVGEDHTKLVNRHLPDQHPMGAITDLDDRLERIEEGVDLLREDVTRHEQSLDNHGELLSEHSEDITNLQRPATSERIGLVKPGEGIRITSDGTISAEGGSGGGGLFLVTFIDEESTITTDKTAAEVHAAVEAGLIVMGCHTEQYFYLNYYDYTSENEYYFEFVNTSYVVSAEGGVYWPWLEMFTWQNDEITDDQIAVNLATTLQPGAVKIGSNIEVNAGDGTISVPEGNASQAGVVKLDAYTIRTNANGAIEVRHFPVVDIYEQSGSYRMSVIGHDPMELFTLVVPDTEYCFRARVTLSGITYIAPMSAYYYDPRYEGARKVIFKCTAEDTLGNPISVTITATVVGASYEVDVVTSQPATTADISTAIGGAINGSY